MAVYQQCPTCKENGKRLIPLKHSQCIKCGTDLARARRAKRVRYWVRYKLPGGQDKKQYVGMSRTGAEAYDDQVRSTKTAKRKGPASNWTYEELFAWYEHGILPSLKADPKTKGRYIDAYRHWEGLFGKLKVNETDITHILRYQSHREALGKSASTINREVQFVGRVVKAGGKNKKIDRDVHIDIFEDRKDQGGKLDEDAPEANPIYVPQYLKLLEAASDELQNLLVAGFNTGMRWNELAQLRWIYIDEENKLIRFPKELTKEGKRKKVKKGKFFKLIPINRHVQEILDRIRAGNPHPEFVFTYRGRPRGDSPTKAMQGACERAGIIYGRKAEGGITFQNLRDSFLTYCEGAGVSKSQQNKIVGHQHGGVRAHYLGTLVHELHKSIQTFTSYTAAEMLRARHKVAPMVAPTDINPA